MTLISVILGFALARRRPLTGDSGGAANEIRSEISEPEGTPPERVLMKTSAVSSFLGTSEALFAQNKLTGVRRRRRIVSSQVNDPLSVYVSDKSVPPCSNKTD